MKSLKFDSEEEIAEIAKVFLELQGWSLYPEVVTPLFGGRPDYIGVRNGSICQAVECKKTLSYPVIEQLARWQIDSEERKKVQDRGYCQDHPNAIPHLLVAFVGYSSGGIPNLKARILNQYRIGVYTICKELRVRWRKTEPDTKLDGLFSDCWRLERGDYTYQIRLQVAPRIQLGSRRTAHHIINELNPDMRIAQAGAKGGQTEYMTPFKRTMNRVKELMSDGKERHIQHIISELGPLGGHHYSSDRVAMSSISKFIDHFKIATRSREHGAWFIIDTINDKD